MIILTDLKRLIGRSWEEISDLKLTYKVEPESGKITLPLPNLPDKFTPEQLCSQLLRHFKNLAENKFLSSITSAVITVPAYFNENQREATKLAGELAGFSQLKIINEPTAAALGCLELKEQLVLVFDLGGGTLDISIIRFGTALNQVEAVGGHNTLGGEDFTQCLVDYVKKELQARGVANLDSTRFDRLRLECERVKILLSSATTAVCNLFGFGPNGSDIRITITRALFEELCGELFQKTIEITKGVLLKEKISVDQIDDILLVGGSNRIPKMRILLEEFFKRRIAEKCHLEEAVGKGAAIHAYNTFINSDEVTNILVDVNPFALGVAVRGGRMAKIIESNTAIPCVKSRTFTNAVDLIQGDTIKVTVYEGNYPNVAENKFLGYLFLDDMPLAPKNTLCIDVKFWLTEESILKVTVVDQSRPGKIKEISINKKIDPIITIDIDD